MAKEPHTVCTVPFELIGEYMPHRGRALLIQEAVVVSLDEDMVPIGGTSAFTVLNWHCEGHFPGNPICPAHILIELAAQVLGVSAFGSMLVYDTEAPTLSFFRGGGDFTIRQNAFPDQLLSVVVEITNIRNAIVAGNVRISCGPALVAEINKLRLVPIR